MDFSFQVRMQSIITKLIIHSFTVLFFPPDNFRKPKDGTCFVFPINESAWYKLGVILGF